MLDTNSREMLKSLPLVAESEDAVKCFSTNENAGIRLSYKLATKRNDQENWSGFAALPCHHLLRLFHVQLLPFF